MKKVKIGATLNSCLVRKLSGNIVFELHGSILKTEYLYCDSGILFLKAYEDDITPKEIIEILVNCFNKSSELEDILKDADVIETWEELKGIIVSIKNIPVLVTRYNHNPKNIYNEWHKEQKRRN